MQFCRIFLLVCVCSFLQSCTSTMMMSEDVQSGKQHFMAGEYKDAFHRLLPAAVNGNMEAQYAVGYMYYYGYGVSQDSESGIFWMNKAAMQGSKPAIRALNLINQRRPYPSTPEIGQAPQRQVYNGNQDDVLQSIAPIKSSVKKYSANKVATNKTTKSMSSVKATTTSSAKKYSLQLFGAYHLADVKQFQKGLISKNATHIFHTQHNNKDWYVLTYGRYATVAQAKKVQNQLPEEVTENNPWVRNVSELNSVG